jgi:hypothetical protein
MKQGRKTRPDVSKWIDDPDAYEAGMIEAVFQLMILQPNATHERCCAQLDTLAERLKARFRRKASQSAYEAAVV